MALHPKMPTLLAFLLPIVLLLSCGQSPTKSETLSAHEPHRLRKGPWFEGWYVRTTDLGGNRSLAVVIGSHVGRNEDPRNRQHHPGYIGILYSEGEGSPTRSWTYFPKNTAVTVEGEPVEHDPHPLIKNDKEFRWDAPGFGSFTRDHLEFSIPGEVEVRMDFGEGKTWDEQGLPLGPEGLMSGLPLPLHWYVKSLSSPTRYHLKVWDPNGQVLDIAGQGASHLEKNWGAAFPKAWNWLQAMAPQDDAQFVWGGGVLSLLSLDIKAWLAGYRSEKESWNLRFSDPGIRHDIKEDYCTGSFQLHAKRLDLEVEISAKAPKSSFGPVAIPTAEGFVPDSGVESFSATIVVKTYRHGLFGKRLTDERTFHNAALEFGAGSYRRSCRR